MFKKLVCFTAVVLVFGLMSTASYGQLLGVYEFDGDFDGASWDEATNWEETVDPFGVPTSGDPATPPSAVTSVDIPLAGVVVDGTMAGQTALDTKIGTAGGTGSVALNGTGALTIKDLFVGKDETLVAPNGGAFAMTGGTLTSTDDIEVGNGQVNGGSPNAFSSVGTMTMSAGLVDVNDDFFIRLGSSLTMTGGFIDIGDRLVTDDDATLDLDGGDILADDDFFFYGASQITVDSGSMIVFDKLRFDNVLTTGKMTINGGFVRSQEFGFCATDCNIDYTMNGTVEINGDGFYQSEAPGVGSPKSQLSLFFAKQLIADGTFITSDTRVLVPISVIVPEFDGRTDVQFTQIFLVPEPASMLLLGLGGLGLMLRRKRAC